MNKVQWIVAKGSCGFNVGDAIVEAAYVNGRSLFVFPALWSKEFWTCVVAGECSCGGNSKDEAKAAGIKFCIEDDKELRIRKPPQKFLDIVNNPERLAIPLD